MTQLPHMPMYWERFFADTELLSVEARGVYALMLGKMWMNGGWLTADDVKLSRLLGVDVRRFRQVYWPALSRYFTGEIDPICGSILRQSRLVAELDKARDLVSKRKAQTARATAERLKKSANGAHVTSKAAASRNEPRNVARNEVGHARAEPEPEEPSSQRDDGSGSPLPPARPPADRGLAVGFVSGAKLPPSPASKTTFLAAFDEAGGDLSKIPSREGAPEPRPEHLTKDGLSVWDRTNERFDPKQPPKEEHHGRPDEDDDGDGDDDDLVRF